MAAKACASTESGGPNVKLVEAAVYANMDARRAIANLVEGQVYANINAKGLNVNPVKEAVCALMGIDGLGARRKDAEEEAFVNIERGGLNVNFVRAEVFASMDAKDLNANHAKAEGCANIIAYDPTVNSAKEEMCVYMDSRKITANRVMEGAFVSIKPGGLYAGFVKAEVYAFMDAISPTVKHAVVSTPVSLMAVLLKQGRGTPSVGHVFLLRTENHGVAKFGWLHSWRHGPRTDCCRCLRSGTDRTLIQILFSAGV